jgi:hypothetical protein
LTGKIYSKIFHLGKVTMNPGFSIQSSDPALLEKATRIARTFAQAYIREDVAGIVFLGAIARGYFDPAADIDIAIFTRPGSPIAFPIPFLKVEGLEIHCHLGEYASERAAPWDMAKRWTYSQGQIFYDPEGKVADLLAEKVPLKPEERKWLLMSGCALSEWYINRLTQLWVERGSLVSAHHMFDEGLNHFFTLLFALNNQLTADCKWRCYCAGQLPLLPPQFQQRMLEIMLLHAFSIAELERRRNAFMGMWNDLLPLVEQEVQMPYAEFLQLV